MADIITYITSELISSEKRITPSWTVSQLKSKLEPITGIPPSSQKLTVYGSAANAAGSTNAGNSQLVDDDDLDRLIGTYNLVPYGRIHVEDTRPPGSLVDLYDTSKVEKYVMPQSEYENRQDSVLHWKKVNKLGRFDPQASDSRALEHLSEESRELIRSRNISIGARCKIDSQNIERLATVRYIGLVPEIKVMIPNQTWVGLEYDEPVGKNDGSIDGKRYFEVSPNHGSFVKPELVEVGDFPEESYEDDEI
jgi:tubulin-specific chaperone B